ncbi:hypothetical protein NPIL_82661 [Nephila pilipes]|uniref:Uncharacterized protein n=1 Tax=Nephila pilipes TaxID=299642 RepID=A0A8X6PFQ7_NEPPI|nr:hypothetical protein NPIL_82661 [Nephila pilipes]
MAKNCRSNVRCLICEKRDFVILCRELRLKNVVTSFKESSNTKYTTALFTQQSPSGIIYLKTLMVHIRNKGKTRSARALLDDGSHRSNFETTLIADLNIPASGLIIVWWKANSRRRAQ